MGGTLEGAGGWGIVTDGAEGPGKGQVGGTKEGSGGRDPIRGRWEVKLQALVYDILPSTTAVFSYAIGSRKLSANEQFFVRAQTVISLLQSQLRLYQTFVL